uniref:Odorant receptor n=1 Tax=Bradysia odoriphaga TaxID=1564500 RepID=A0A6B9C911_9DIPT|nr:odorant receptor 47 [Bradysia odoriphaga]
MYPIQIHKFFSQLISFFHRFGFWHRGNEANVRELIVQFILCFYHLSFVVALVIGATRGENGDQGIFLMEIAVAVGVTNVKLFAMVLKQKQILVLINRIGSFSIKHDEDYNIFNARIESFVKFVKVFMVTFYVVVFFEVGVAPFLNNEYTLFFQIAFPLDWKHNAIYFWIANIFLGTGVGLSGAPIMFSATVWYLLLICSSRYDALANELRNMGRLKEQERVGASNESWNHKVFLQDLISSIDRLLHLRGLINDVEAFCSFLFFVQLGTSGLCICGSVYALAFSLGNNLLEFIIHVYILFYNISEIFMITYFGNEIMLSSQRLAYSLFASDWIEQPQSTKKILLIFGEHLKRSHQLLIAKLYPLTLGTFTSIVRSAYSMFNVLKEMND